MRAEHIRRSVVHPAPRPARRPRAALLAAATAAVAAALAVPLAGLDGAEAAVGQFADAKLIQLQVTDVPALNTTGFQGTYGTAESTVIDGPDNNGDFSDPDHVLTYVTIDGAQTNRTSNTSAKVYAQSQNSGMTLRIGNAQFLDVRKPSGEVATLDTYAECTPPPVGPYALAYARTAANMITVLGRPVSLGTTSLTVSGTELGEPTTLGSDNTITVRFTRHEEPAGGGQTPGVYTARAWVDIVATGVLRNPAGQEVYDGPITTVRLGAVEAHCETVVTPSPSPSSSSPSPSPSPSESVSPSPSPSPSPSGSQTRTPLPSGSSGAPPEPSPSGSGTPLAPTGTSMEPVLAAALVLLAGGLTITAAVGFGRRDRRRH